MMDHLLLAHDEAARQLRVSLKTLWDWDRRGFGPRPVRLGTRVRYKVTDLTEWLDELSTEASPTP